MVADLPRVSAIITNWNYAPYLATAIDSVLGQTFAVHQCIVVDDGSTDGSRAIIEGYGDRVTPLFRANGGQAAAFNSGFAVATGDVILFVDADDVLKLEAVATIVAAWHDDLAGISFGMEVIDRRGNASGLLPVKTHDIDNRPLLTELGAFAFMPTSGNAFARRVVEAAFPMPETRWKISADAYLLRVAALAGRILPLPHVLAQYRVHEANNYYRVGAAKLWANRRDVRDIVDLARFFSSNSVAAQNLGLSRGERLAWQTAALRFGAVLVQLGDRSIDLGEDLRRMARMVMGMPAPLWARLATSVGLLLASAGWWRNPDRITWLQRRQDRPRWLESLVSFAGRSRVWDPLRPDRRPRWRSPTPIGRLLATDVDPEADEALSGDIRRPRFDGAPVIGGNRAYLDIELAPTPLPLSIEIGLVARGDPTLTIGVDASVDGELTGQTSITGEGTVVVPLPRNTAAWGGAVRIHLQTRAHDSPWARFNPSYWLGVPTRLAVATIAIKPLTGALDPPAALPQRPLPARMYVEQNREHWRHMHGGAIEMRGRAATLRFTGIDRGASLMMVIDPGEEQPAGWMRIGENGTRLFEGRWDGAGRITLELPHRPPDEYWVSALEFRFSPDDPLEGRKPVISVIDFRAVGVDPARHPRSGGKGPLLNAGQQLTFFETSPGAKALGPQFTMDNEGSASISGLGEIEFRIVPETVDAQLQLDISQPFGTPAGKIQVITVLSDDAVLAQVGLNGSTTLAVPLDPLVRRGKTGLKLSLVSVYLDLSGLSDPALQAGIPAPAPLLLTAMELEGQRPTVLPDHLQAAGSSIDGLLLSVRETLGGELVGQQSAELLRTRLVAMLEGSDLRAMLSILADGDTVSLLAALGRMAGPPTEGDATFPWLSRLREETALPEDRASAVRHVMLALLTLPASSVPALADLAAIPAPFLWYPEAIAAYLGDDPALLIDVDNSGYEAFLTRLVAGIDAGLTQPPGTPQHVLAVATLKALRPQYVLFGAGTCKPLLQSLGRAIERHLVLSGRTLAHAFLPAPRTGPRRVGVILRTDRAGPEGMIVSAMLKGLDPDQFTPVLILLEREPEGAGSLAVTCETIELRDLRVDASVARIREAQLDIFVLGSFFIGLDNLTAIVAHKLAPVQVATTAISPVTTGLSSFDAMISSPLLDAGAAGDYVEPLLLAEGHIQGFDRPLPDLGGQLPDLTRRLLGLPLDTMIFASGAMMRKIGEPLMSAWARILAHTPDSVLVLYPFADSWRIDYAPARFRRWAETVLAGFGVAPDRLIIRTDLGTEDVSRLLSVCDVYLDSFPYAGATTVTEALDVGLPVVALKGGHQRGRQGSAWLQAWGLQADAAPSVDTYVRRAVKLGTDEHLRDDRRRRIRRVSRPPHRDLAALGRTFGDALIAADGGETAPIARRPTNYRYLFHHMPKAAGTSCREVFLQWFSKLHPDYRRGWQRRNLQAPLDLENIGPGELVLGHFELPALRISRRYPEIYNGKDWRMFSIVREPLDMAISNYFFTHRRRADDPTFRPISLSASLRRKNKSAYCDHFNCKEKNWREVLDHYWFIGTMERLEESLGYIARELGQPMVDVPWENTTPRPMEPDVEDVTAYLRINELDYEIYNEICRRLERRLTEQDS